jgi:hypothetical protein
MPGIRIDHRDDPVRSDPPGDPECPGRVLLQFLPVQRSQQRAGVAGQRIDQRLPRRRVVLVAGRLACRGVSSPRASSPRSSAARSPSHAFSTPRIADRTSVTVSIVATASYSGVESITRRRTGTCSI